MVIRSAELDDAQAIARCHIAAWRDTYRPIIADEYLDNLSLDDHVAKWTKNLQQPGCHTFVAEHDQRGFVGFIHGGQERTRRTDFQGEIYAIYILKEIRGRGIGRKMFQRIAGALVQDQITTLIVWALEGNECRAAYASWGGVEIERGPIKIGQQDLIEVAYGWRDIRSVAS
jgi:GNAT superfamily N-acetyltransferase